MWISHVRTRADFMNRTYICAPCRRQLLLQTKGLSKSQWHQRVGFVSLKAPATRIRRVVEENDDEEDDYVDERVGAGQRRVPKRIPPQFPQSVEADFAARILENCDLTGGPYSNPRPRSIPVKIPPANKSKKAARIIASLDNASRAKGNVSTSYNVDHVSKRVLLRSQLALNPFRGSTPSAETTSNLDEPYNPNSAPLAENVSELAHGESFPQVEFSLKRPSFGFPRRKVALRKLSGADVPQTHNSTMCDAPNQKLPLRKSTSSELAPTFGTSDDAASAFKPTASPKVTSPITSPNRSRVRRHDASQKNVSNHPQKVKIGADPPSPGPLAIVEKLVDPFDQSKMFKSSAANWCSTNDVDVERPSRRLQALPRLISTYEATKLTCFAIWTMLAYALQHPNSTTEISTGRSISELLEETVCLWTHLLVTRAQCYTRNSAGTIQEIRHTNDWNAFVNSEQMKDIRSWSSKNLADRFLYFFTSKSRHHLFHMESALLVTFVLLRKYQKNLTVDPRRETKDIRGFMDFTAHLLTRSSALESLDSHIGVISSYCRKPDDVKLIVNDLEEALLSTGLILAESRAASVSSTDQFAEHHHVRVQEHLEELFKKRIGRAMSFHDHNRIESLWQEAQTSFETRDAMSTSTIPTTIHYQFLTAFMAIKRPNKAIEVWNVMMRSNIAPLVAAWDAMIKGCGLARDTKGMETLWQRMLISGIRPDARVWATRIQGLMSAGNWHLGKKAFEDMTRLWLEAARENKLDIVEDLGAIDDVAKPTTHCLNVLIQGFARAGLDSEMGRALSWIRILAIEPDTYTFNPLVKSALTSGNLSLASKILKQMVNLGIEPDVATFTILLDDIANRDSSPSPKSTESTDTQSEISLISLIETNSHLSQSQAIANVFAVMSQYPNLSPNGHTFTTLVSGLLKSQPANVDAAYAVLAYMSSKGITFPSTLYTSLVTHHFSTDPPELTAIEALWQRVTQDRNAHLDVIFYDRVIEGWAKAGFSGKAMAVLGRAQKYGKLVGWVALTQLLRSLLGAGDSSRAQQVYEQAMQEEAKAGNDRSRHNMGRSGFFTLVKGAGLHE